MNEDFNLCEDLFGDESETWEEDYFPGEDLLETMENQRGWRNTSGLMLKNKYSNREYHPNTEWEGQHQNGEGKKKENKKAIEGVQATLVQSNEESMVLIDLKHHEDEDT